MLGRLYPDRAFYRAACSIARRVEPGRGKPLLDRAYSAGARPGHRNISASARGDHAPRGSLAYWRYQDWHRNRLTWSASRRIIAYPVIILAIPRTVALRPAEVAVVSTVIPADADIHIAIGAIVNRDIATGVEATVTADTRIGSAIRGIAADLTGATAIDAAGAANVCIGINLVPLAPPIRALARPLTSFDPPIFAMGIGADAASLRGADARIHTIRAAK